MQFYALVFHTLCIHTLFLGIFGAQILCAKDTQDSQIIQDLPPTNAAQTHTNKARAKPDANDNLQLVESGELDSGQFALSEMATSIVPTMVWGGVVTQLVSFHLGYTGAWLDSSSHSSGQNGFQSGGSVGVSAGVNYLLPNPFYWHGTAGLRARYLYEYGSISQHTIGAVGYFHFLNGESKTLRFETFAISPALMLGGGYIANAKYGGISSNGSYVEAGLAFFKWFPVGNFDVLYRASFYDTPLDSPLLPTDSASNVIHSLNVIFTFF